jgi:ubiquinone/menaquinone biosynthesis C-methylase UbiE
VDKSYWEVSDEKEIWLRTAGVERESQDETERHIATILDGIPRGKVCIEIGAGIGRLLRAAVRNFDWAIGFDYSIPIQKASELYLKNSPHCKVCRSDGMVLPWASNLADFVYSYTVFHHMPTLGMIQSNLQEAYRVLKPDGLCKIQTIKGNRSDGYDGHVFESEDEFWNEFKAVGFLKEKVEVLQEPKDRAANRIWITARKP